MRYLRATTYLSSSILAAALCSACSGDRFTTSDGAAGDDSQVGGSGGAAAGSGGSGASSQVGGSGGSGGGTGGSGATGGEPGGSGGSGATGGEPGGSGGTGATGGEPGGSGGTGGVEGGTGGQTGGTAGEPGGSGGTGGEPGGTGGGPGGTGGAPGGTGGVVGAEDCLNGLDDNGNLLVDCADPACRQGYTCVAQPPDGWIGVGWVTSEEYQDCSADFPTYIPLYDEENLVAEDASCSCSCSHPVEQVCNVVLYCSPTQDCSNQPGAGVEVGPACTDFEPGSSSGDAVAACTSSSPFSIGGLCYPTGTASIPPYSWPGSGRACLRSTGGQCEGEAICVPVLDPDAYGPCIAQVGDYVCPAPYTQKTLYRDGNIDDTRDCELCTCSAPSGALCECESSNQCGVSVYNGDCTNGNPLANVPADNTSCAVFQAPAPGTGMMQLQGAAVTAMGQCAPSSPKPTGEVFPTGTITLCCVP